MISHSLNISIERAYPQIHFYYRTFSQRYQILRYTDLKKVNFFVGHPVAGMFTKLVEAGGRSLAEPGWVFIALYHGFQKLSVKQLKYLFKVLHFCYSFNSIAILKRNLGQESRFTPFLKSILNQLLTFEFCYVI